MRPLQLLFCIASQCTRRSLPFFNLILLSLSLFVDIFDMNEMHIQKDIGSFSPASAYQPTEYMYSVLKNMVYSHNESAYIITQKHIDDTMQTKSNIKCGIEAERRSECCFCFCCCCTITTATATPWNMSAVLNVQTWCIHMCALQTIYTQEFQSRECCSSTESLDCMRKAEKGR